ncbi:MAG: HAMP domain-containing sensor histidine kinase [Gammaproteobacteria bacterium]|nr:MAG: HAMP domain-containing sensor histidine kinase [Gammaproteobacteria bacterium]
MRFRTSLRYRISIAFALLGGVISLALAGILYWLTISMEERLIAETLSAELEDFIERYAEDPATVAPSSTVMRTYVIDDNTLASVPEVLRRMSAGLHQMPLDDRSYFAEVRVQDNKRFVLLYDDAQIQHKEQQFKAYLAGGVLIMLGLSAALGLWLAERVVSPVGELARRVGNLEPRERALALATDFPRDEVGILAKEFDAYQERLRAFIDREQAFTADVSHELRTPLAVIEGAAEVLQEDAALDDAQRTRVRRIARAAHEMTEVTHALLELAREQQQGKLTASCEVDKLLQEVVDSHRHLLETNNVTVDITVRSAPVLSVECALLRIVVGNLIRNAFSYTTEGCVRITLDSYSISVADTGAGIPKQQLEEVFKPFYSTQGGEGIGLSLVRRICQHYGWQIKVSSQVGKGTRFRLDFSEQFRGQYT